MRTVAHARVSPTSSSRPSTSASALARRASFRVAVRGDTARDAFFALGPARPRARRAHAAPRAFLWWSREKELRKRWKQLADFAADEIPESSPLARSK